jgi:hypothetical protein
MAWPFSQGFIHFIMINILGIASSAFMIGGMRRSVSNVYRLRSLKNDINIKIN